MVFAARGDDRGPGVDFFEQRIRPVLVEHCYECHSADSRKLKGGLRLDTRDGIRQGGATRAAVVPGNASRSLLMEATGYGNPELQMPPKGRLPEAVVADLRAWIDAGAEDPRVEAGARAPGARATSAGTHWAFQPIGRPAIPSGKGAAGPVDRFLAASLSQRGLALAPEADRRTLIRRATYDLTGLPPTPEQIRAFLNDVAPLAYERLVDRLLASPGYGERWGRWWLDLARYADTNGQDENKVMANAWRYRDWVIRSFNVNQPLDQFITHQLAGDLLPTNGLPLQEIHRRWTATGFLVLGPKMLAEQDKPKLVMDLIDEQIDVTTRAFLGLTVGCARCHDHKFDPVPARDYYALAGIFKSTKTMTNLAFVSKFNERRIPTDDEPEALALAVEEDRPVDLPVHLRGSHLNLAKDPVPRGFIRVANPGSAVAPPSDRSGRLELAHWLTGDDNPLTSRVLVNRVWQAHFGEGLVRTPDNFGLRGETPTHPELLDWLATEFRRSGWDLKHLHRLLLTSAAWRQSGLAGLDATRRTVGDRLDPENRLLWHFPRQRLEAEMVRDAVLAVSGRLDATMGGTLVNGWKNDDYVPTDEVSATSLRRSVYLPIVRDRVFDVFTLFDFANPSVGTAKRTPTVVSHQALFFLNSPMVKASSAALAESLCTQPALRPGDRVNRACQRAFGRPATGEETAGALAFIARIRRGNDPASERTAWAAWCQVLFAANEFLYRE